MSATALPPRPAPPPRRVRECGHGPMNVRWVVDLNFHWGGYWRLSCAECTIEALERYPAEEVFS